MVGLSCLVYSLFHHILSTFQTIMKRMKTIKTINKFTCCTLSHIITTFKSYGDFFKVMMIFIVNEDHYKTLRHHLFHNFFPRGSSHKSLGDGCHLRKPLTFHSPPSIHFMKCTTHFSFATFHTFHERYKSRDNSNDFLIRKTRSQVHLLYMST